MEIGNLKKLLSTGYIYVEFTKKDGSLRQMWATRDNQIISDCGHEIIQFNHAEIKMRETKNPHLLYVYDIQENDTRILNSRTVKEETLKHYNILGEVLIPRIVTRFEKKESESSQIFDKEFDFHFDDSSNKSVEDLFL